MLTTEQNHIERIWSLIEKIGARMLTTQQIEAMTAELWDGPASNAVFVWEFLKVTVSGAEPAQGQNRKVTIKL